MGTNVHLTPELERFARECVEGGRYNDVSEVVRSGLRMLQYAESRRRAFIASLEAASAEAERDGVATIEEVEEEGNAIIAEARARHGRGRTGSVR